MSIPNNYKAEIGIESVLGDGGAAHTPIPLSFDSIPKLKYTRRSLPVVGGSKARQKTYVDVPYYEMDAKFYLKGAVGAGVASELGKLLRIFGLSQTVNGGVSVVYSPRDTGYESAGIKVNTDGKESWMKGAKGAILRIPLIASERSLCEANIWSLFTAPTAVGYSAPTFADAAVTPEIVQNLGLTINGQNHAIPRITLILDNQIQIEPNVNAANQGINDFVYGTREFTVEILAKRDTNNDVEWWADLIASTERALASTGFGTAGGNKWDFDAANMQLLDVEEVEEFGQIYYKVTGGINYHATLASELSIKHV